MARELGIHRHTVEKYLAFDSPPERRHSTKKVSAIAPYEEYILERWEQGCRNANRIWREISEQGYPGVYQNVVRITRYLKKQERLGRAFAVELLQDTEAVVAAMVLPYSQGQTEGRINKR